MKLATPPVRVTGVVVRVRLRVKVGSPTTAVTCPLSAPRQLPLTGVTVYFHVPGLTVVSVQVVPVTVPMHEPEAMVCVMAPVES